MCSNLITYYLQFNVFNHWHLILFVQLKIVYFFLIACNKWKYNIIIEYSKDHHKSEKVVSGSSTAGEPYDLADLTSKPSTIILVNKDYYIQRLEFVLNNTILQYNNKFYRQNWMLDEITDWTHMCGYSYGAFGGKYVKKIIVNWI